MAAREADTENNNIGSAIQYFRDTYQISQGKLCMGLCSIPTLSRIESGERDVDSLLLETLLERLGKTANQFELILTDSDYVIYQKREEIKKQIENKDIDAAYSLLNDYEAITDTKSSVHKQFIITCRALLNELQGGAPEKTADLFMEAIYCTVPDFKTNELKEYYLSNTELNIIIDMVQRMIQAQMKDKAKEILLQVLKYLEFHSSMEESIRLYPKIALIAGNLLVEENEFEKAYDICIKGLKANKGSRKLDYCGELSLLKARIVENIAKFNNWEQEREGCLELYLQAYHVFDFCGESAATEEIRKHLLEEYQWEDTD